MTKVRFVPKEQMLTGDGAPKPERGTITTKPTRTDEEQFWISIRRGLLELVNAIETCKLSERIDISTSQVRKWLKSYQRTYTYPPIAAEDVRERIAELIVEKAAEEARALTTGAECDKL